MSNSNYLGFNFIDAIFRIVCFSTDVMSMILIYFFIVNE